MEGFQKVMKALESPDSPAIPVLIVKRMKLCQANHYRQAVAKTNHDLGIGVHRLF